MSTDQCKEDPRSTRLVCAKLYEGGLLSAYEILSNIRRKPFKGKSPEFELDIDNITKHAEVAFKRHMKFALLAIGLSFLGLITHGFSIDISCIFSVFAICLLSLKPILDRNVACENFVKSNYNPDYNLHESSKNGVLTEFCNWITQNNIISDEDEGKKQNIILFGDYFPFLGAGKRVRNWNFVIDSSKKQKKESNNMNDSNVSCEDSSIPQEDQDEEQNPDELSIKELYKAVSSEIENKAFPINLPPKYILFADGKEADKTDFLLNKDDDSRPNTYLESIDPFSKDYKEDSFKDYRMYLHLKYHDKTRSTLFSTFLRFSKIGKNLFTECSFHVLTPIDEDIYNIDKLPINGSLFSLKRGIITFGLVAVYIMLVQSVITPTAIFALTTLPLFKILNNGIKEDEYNSDAKKIKRGEPHNYGRLETFRETIASPDFKNYFSAQDIIMVQSTLEKSIINSVADLLDDKELDTSFLRGEMISFINKGIMQFGGQMETAQVVSGEGNQVTSNIRHIQEKVFGASKEA